MKKKDPFGNLTDWGLVLDTLENLATSGELSQCQPGLIRILRYKGNWRLREEVLKHAGKVQNPSKELLHQLIAILDDDNIYYDARIISGNALIQLLKQTKGINGDTSVHDRIFKVTEQLKRTPQPPFFHQTINRLHTVIGVPNRLES